MSIAGDWFNELGSMVTFRVDPADPRQLAGSYHTRVGRAQHQSYPISGRCDAAGLPDQVLSWVVVWDPPDSSADEDAQPSITAWVGQRHVVSGVEFISTTWLLTRMSNAKDDWESTRVSVDFFFRKQPTPEMLTLAKRFGKVASHVSPAIATPEE